MLRYNLALLQGWQVNASGQCVAPFLRDFDRRVGLAATSQRTFYQLQVSPLD
jgi:hypothetical protein